MQPRKLPDRVAICNQFYSARFSYNSQHIPNDAMTSDTSSPVSKSGIAKGSQGENYIPSSTRADGSLRKEIRVRPGYKPPEDVEVYRNSTAQAWKTRGKGGVPGAEFVGLEKIAKSAGKSGRRAEKDASERDTAAQEKDKAVSKMSEPEPEDPEVTEHKEARKLSKKLRQARELQQKKEKGDGLLPEQFEKVIKINELIRQLDKLGFDQEGQKKEAG